MLKRILLSVCVLSLGLSHLPALSAQHPPKAPGPLDVELEDLRPGLVAVYRSLADKDAAVTRLDAKPAFALGHSSPHPRLPAGPIEVTWTGVLFLKEPAPVSFDAYVCGEVTIAVDGVTVLQGRGERETARVDGKEKLNRPTGLYRLKIVYRALPALPARLQVWWQGPSFSREPLPAWQLMYLAAEAPAALLQEQLAEKGRTAVVRLGCARCHAGAFPGVNDPPPGPALSNLGKRVQRDWLMSWLNHPAKLRPDVRMPALFAADRKGFVERSILADYLIGPGAGERRAAEVRGDERLGRRAFVMVGCSACHFVPDQDRAEQPDFDRFPLVGLVDRLPADELASFLSNPIDRYPDGRMPRLPLPPDVTRDLAAYLLADAKPATPPASAEKPPTAEEISELSRRLGTRGLAATATALLREKGCAQCHPGIGQSVPSDVPIKAADSGCLVGKTLPRYQLDEQTKKNIAAYRALAGREKHPSPFASRQWLIDRLGCFRCHQRDSDRPPPLETISSTVGGAYLQYVPFQRTPRLTGAHQKYTRAHLLSAVREGVIGLRPGRYSYRMPSFGTHAEAIVQALAEGDGELPAAPEPPPQKPADPTLATLHGPVLAGFQGYACVSCHVWNGQMLSEPDPGAIGTDLTRVVGRIRRDWFDRFLEEPGRSHPGTPMPGVFPKGKPATLTSILDGDPARQKEALWSYFTLGKEAPSPKPPPPLPVPTPSAGEGPLIAQVPLRLPGGAPAIEGLCVLFASHDLFVYDVGPMTLHSGYTGAQVLRGVHGRLRTFAADGKPIGTGFLAEPPLQMIGPGKPEKPTVVFHGYDRLADGVRLRWQAKFQAGNVEVAESLRLGPTGAKRHLLREFTITGVPAGRSLELRSRVPDSLNAEVQAMRGELKRTTVDGVLLAVLTADAERAAQAVFRYELPPPGPPPPLERTVTLDTGKIDGVLERPGYRALVYPRPKTAAGDDRVMPTALAVNPKDGRVFVASMKTGELFVLNDPGDSGKSARFLPYGRGLYQEAWSMLAEPDALYVLHRRNLTRITETKRDGVADRLERVFPLPHGVADTYDYGYGLVRDRTGNFLTSYAPYANTTLPGSGGVVRLVPGQKPLEVGFGFRNPVGWCTGPEGEVFFTDNQGEWVATNKLCHLVEGRFYGFPNPAQRQHTTRPFGKTAIWVPYGWARSINGVTCDNTGGKFGPFAGQFFLAELMFGGAIVRASVEKVNGEYQGACFPFWGRGLLGPVTLAFDPKGRLFVGGITEPGWMAQPDRGALFRLDFTGQVPFEMQTIQVRPRGFKIVFTRPVSAASARQIASYAIEHYRYDYTGAYGSPELDRTRVAIERVELAADGKSVELTTAPLVKDRVYLIQARGVRSEKGEPLVHPVGAYTLNELPAVKR